MVRPQAKSIVFYSWQSDLANNTNRGFIQTALERAAKAIRDDDSVQVEPVVDRDTQGVPGAPMIAETILAKIDAATAFVADVTIIGKTESGRTTSNPNVLHELGYAPKALGTDRLVLVLNEAFGPIEQLPVDLRHRLVLKYHLSQGASEEERRFARRGLQSAFEVALREILAMPRRQSDVTPAERALEGARILRDVAAKALGPRGGRAIYQSDERTRTTRDGLVIARRYWSPDLFERHGMDRLNDVAEEVRTQAGDGSKTTMLLCYELVRGGYDAVADGKPLKDILKGIEEGTRLAVDYLRAISQPITKTDPLNVAKTAGADVGEFVVTALEQAGDSGGISIENQSVPSKSSIEMRLGFWLSEGYVSPDFANDPATGGVVLHGCALIICERKIASILEIRTLLEKLVTAQTPVAIIAEDFENEVIASLLENNNRGVLSSVAVRLPRTRESLRAYFRDLAIVTGGRVLGGHFGPSFAVADLGDLGTAKTITVTNESTQVLEGNADQTKLETLITQLKQLANRASSYGELALRGRIANLIGNVTAIKVGGRTATDLEDQRYRVETSLATCRLAAASGFVAGGGMAFVHAKASLAQPSEASAASEAQASGCQVVSRALEEPLRSLLTYSGLEPTSSLEQLSGLHAGMGWDVSSGRIVDLETTGILDATDTLIAALEIASLQARTILQTSSWELLLNPRQLPWVAGAQA